MIAGPHRPGPEPAWAWAGIALLLLLVAALRILPVWGELVPPEGGPPRPVDNDALFHLRHATHVAEHFPDLRRWEDVARYPELERNDASGLWDFALGTAGRLGAVLTGAGPAQATAWVAFFAPPLALALTFFLGWRLLRRVAGPGLALVGALWLAALPGDTFFRTAAGYCDHHVVEMLCGVWLALAWVRLLMRDHEQTAPWWKPAWGAAAPLTVLHFSWLGGPLHLALWCATAGVQALLALVASDDARPVTRAATRVLLAHATMAGVVGLCLPDAVLRPALHGWMLAGAAGAAACFRLAGAASEAALRRWPARGGRVAGVAAGTALALGGLAWAASPALRAAWRFGFGEKAGTVLEHLPVGPGLFFQLGGAAAVLMLLAPGLLAASGGWRKPAATTVVSMGLLHVALWARTGDYVYQVALWSALAASAGLASVAAAWPRTGRIATALATLGILLGAGRWTYPPIPRGPAGRAEAVRVNHEGWAEVATWWRALPPPAAPADAPPPPDAPFPPRGAAGVLGDWASGNVVNTYTGWPTVSSRYPDAEGLLPLFAGGEAEALALPLRGSTVEAATRWLAIEPRTFGDYFFGHVATLGLPPETFLGRARIDTPEGVREVAATGPAYEGLLGRRLLTGDGSGFGRFRLVFESSRLVALRHLYAPATQRWHLQSDRVPPEGRPGAEAALARRSWPEGPRIGYRGEMHPSVKIFELVPGATLRGTAPPGATVRARLEATAQTTGRRLRLEWTTRADADGGWRLRVPYATEGLPEWVRVTPEPEGYAIEFETGPAWASLGPATPARVRVREADLQAGAELRVGETR